MVLLPVRFWVLSLHAVVWRTASSDVHVSHALRWERVQSARQRLLLRVITRHGRLSGRVRTVCQAWQMMSLNRSHVLRRASQLRHTSFQRCTVPAVGRSCVPGRIHRDRSLIIL
jgi:hypothetical protein